MVFRDAWLVSAGPHGFCEIENVLLQPGRALRRRKPMRLVLVGLLVSTSAFAQFAFGVKGGAPLTDFFRVVDNPGATFRSGSTPFIVGPTIEVHFPFGFGVEFDPLYRKFHYDASSNLVDAVVNGKASNAWEFPILLKYRVPGVIVRPFLDAGFAFDRWSGVSQVIQTPSSLVTTTSVSGTNKGAVLGAGLEFNLHLVRVSPEIRYTRWGATNLADFGGVLRSNKNQAEVLIGLTF